MPQLSAPSGVCVYSTVNGLCIRVNWCTVDGACSYSVFRSEIPHDGFTMIASGVAGLTFFDNPQARRNLNVRNLWYYAVASFDGTTLWPQSPPSTYEPYGELIHKSTPRPGMSFWSLIY